MAELSPASAGNAVARLLAAAGPILSLDIGSGTQDVLLALPGERAENWPRFVLPSPALGIADRIREFDVSSATVELAAVAVGVEGARIAKSMSFKLADDAPIIIVTAGDRKIDNAKYKAYFHVKAKMLTFDEACAFTGHAPGGVCSFALPENVKTYLDVSLKRFDTVFPAAGSANSAIEMTCDELEKYSSNFVAWVDVCKEKAPAPQA